MEQHSVERQVLVIGLDGATFDIIDPLLAEGKLPTLARLQKEGTRATLTSTVPPNSAPAWTSFMTGVSPAKHRILDFREMDLRRYELYTGGFVNATSFAGHTIFDFIGEHSRGVVAFRVPMTFPVWPLNGILVAGYPTPDRERAYTYPPELAEDLTPIAIYSHDEILKAGIAEERRNADYEIEGILKHMGRWLRENRHDFYMAVTGISDGFHHKFWKYHDPNHPLHDPQWPERDKNIIREYYTRLDAMVGELLSLVDDRWLVVVMSDHGGGPRPWREFNTNAWLAQQGWLVPAGGTGTRWVHRILHYGLEWARNRLPLRHWVAEHVPLRLRQEALAVRQATNLIDWAQTRAYRVPLQFPAEGIEINLRGRQPQGVVTPGIEYETLRDEIIAGLRQLKDPESGEPVVRAIWRREELYPDGDPNALPDILFITAPHLGCGSGLESTFSRVPLSFLERLNGDHTMEGITYFWGQGVKAGQRIELNMLDLAPTLLWAMGLPVPQAMDGRVLKEVFEDPWAARPVERADIPWLAGEEDMETLTAEEEAEIRKALAGLGYVDED